MTPLFTTTARIVGHSPCTERRERAAVLLGVTEPSDDPITYDRLLDVLGLDDALWCCRAEAQYSANWRRYAVWCARQVQHLMTDARSIAALDMAERHAAECATDEELAAARAAAWTAAWAARDAARAAAWDAAWAAARAAARDAAWAAWAAAWAAAQAAAWDAARAAARDAAWDAAWAAAWDALRQRQADAFRLLVTTGELP